MLVEGSAFVDSTGRVVAAEEAFLAALALPPRGATEALRRRAAADPALAGLLAGGGPDALVLPEAPGAPACRLTRVASEAGMLLRACSSEGSAPAPAVEYALQALVLSRLAGSVAHEVKNPLNAMALQLALLGDKIGTASETLASACAGNLASIKNQIGRVNEIVRRYLDVADPSGSTDFDAGALLADIAHLFGHEARRRRVTLACEAAPGTLRAGGDPVRVARLLLGILWRAITTTPEGGRLDVRAAPAGDDIVVSVAHTRGQDSALLSWVGAVVASAAAEMGGRLDEEPESDPVRIAWALPRERPL